MITKKEKRSIIIGMVMGDAHLYEHRKCYGIKITHSRHQLEYVKYKKKLLEEIFDCDPINIRTHNNNGYIGHTIEKGSKKFRLYRKKLYPNGKKTINKKFVNYLTPLGISILYMDDGSLYAKKRDGKIHAYELCISTYTSREENQILIDYFKKEWDVHFTCVKSKNHTRLRCGTKQARKFIEIVRPHIIESMLYKITMQPFGFSGDIFKNVIASDIPMG